VGCRQLRAGFSTSAQSASLRAADSAKLIIRRRNRPVRHPWMPTSGRATTIGSAAEGRSNTADATTRRTIMPRRQGHRTLRSGTQADFWNPTPHHPSSSTTLTDPEQPRSPRTKHRSIRTAQGRRDLLGQVSMGAKQSGVHQFSASASCIRAVHCPAGWGIASRLASITPDDRGKPRHPTWSVLSRGGPHLRVGCRSLLTGAPPLPVRVRLSGPGSVVLQRATGHVSAFDRLIWSFSSPGCLAWVSCQLRPPIVAVRRAARWSVRRGGGSWMLMGRCWARGMCRAGGAG
jgi:hypothetical protein